MGRGSNRSIPDLAGVVNVKKASTVPVLSTRPSDGSYDQEDLIYFSGGDLPTHGLRLVAGSVYVSVHAREGGNFQVQRQIQRPKGRLLGLEKMQIEALYDGTDLGEAVTIAASAWREMRDEGATWDGISASNPPELRELEQTRDRLDQLRQDSRDGRGPRLVTKETVQWLKDHEAPAHLIEAAERAIETNPTAIDRSELPRKR